MSEPAAAPPPSPLVQIVAALNAERAKIDSGEIVALEIQRHGDHIKIKYVGYKTVKLTAA